MTPTQLAEHTRALVANRLGEEILARLEAEARVEALAADLGQLQAESTKIKAAYEDLEAKAAKAVPAPAAKKTPAKR